MKTENASAMSLCPECGAPRREGSDVCWICNRAFSDRGPTLGKAGLQSQPEPGHFSFHLRTILLGITCVAICLGVGRQAPGLGVFLAIVMTMAWGRTARFTNLQSASGKEATAAAQTKQFLKSSLMTIWLLMCLWFTLCVSLIVAFSAACYAAAGSSNVYLIWAAGIAAGLLSVTVGIRACNNIAKRMRYDPTT